MAERIDYHSEGNISQADLEMPDALDFAMLSKGSGIGNTTELGYVNGIRESITVGGEVKWTSFREMFNVDEIEIQEET